MAEIEGMTDAQIEAAIKEMESQIRRERNEYTNTKKQADDLDQELADCPVPSQTYKNPCFISLGKCKCFKILGAEISKFSPRTHSFYGCYNCI